MTLAGYSIEARGNSDKIPNTYVLLMAALYMRRSSSTNCQICSALWLVGLLSMVSFHLARKIDVVKEKDCKFHIVNRFTEGETGTEENVSVSTSQSPL